MQKQLVIYSWKDWQCCRGLIEDIEGTAGLWEEQVLSEVIDIRHGCVNQAASTVRG